MPISLSSYANGSHAYIATLATALSNSRSFVPRPITPSRADNTFAAANLLAKIFLACEGGLMCDRDEAQRILSADGEILSLASLEERSLVRFVLGRLYIPVGLRYASFLRVPAAKTYSHRQQAEVALSKQLSEQEQKALRTLIQVQRSKQRPWISKATLETLHAQHQSAHPATPNLEVLIPVGSRAEIALEGVDGFELNLHEVATHEIWDPFQSQLHSRALAIFWEFLLSEKLLQTDPKRFNKWWNIAASLRSHDNAPAFMSEDAKKRFIAQCQEMILEQVLPTAHGKETERLAWEFHDGFPGAKAIMQEPQSGASLVEWYNWLHRPERQFLSEPFDDGLKYLINIVVINDSPNHGEGTLTLLEAAETKPFLLYGIVEALANQGRPMLAVVISNLRTSSLGIKILHDLDIAESPDAQWNGGPKRGKMKDDGVTVLWTKALNVFLGALHAATGIGGSFETRELSEVLLITALAAVRPNGANPTSGPMDRWQILIDCLSDLDAPVLGAMLSSLIEDFVNVPRIQSRYVGFSVRMPVAELFILFWLLDTAADPTLIPAENTLLLADTILTLYTNELAREKDDSGRAVYWIDDAPVLLQLPWAKLAVILTQADRGEELVEPKSVSLEGLVNSVSTPTEGEPELVTQERSTQKKAAYHKIRLHLRILLSIHGLLSSGKASSTPLTTPQLETLLTQLRSRVRSMVSNFASPSDRANDDSLFKFDLTPQISSFPSHELRPMAETLIYGINQFPLAEAEATFGDWIIAETDPRILLEISLKQVPESVREHALTRLDSIDVEGFINTTLWITDLIQLGERASEAGKTQLVQKILTTGDRVMEGRTFLEWQIFAFQTRLLLAFKAGDLNTIRSIPLPKAVGIATHVKGSSAKQLEESRRFYIALVQMETAPDQALKEFEELHQRHPEVAAYANNAFVVSNAITSKIEDPEQRKREFGRICDRFEGLRSKLSQTAQAKSKFAINKLIGLNGAENDCDFDVEWANLTANQKTHIDFIEIAVVNATRRGESKRIERLLKDARPFNLTATGEASSRFAELMSETTEVQSSEITSHVIIDVDESADDTPRRHYLESIVARPAKVAQVFGGEMMRVDEFLWTHLEAAAREGLLRKKLFTHLKHENPISDVTISLLRMRLAFIQSWHVVDQSRGGESEGGKDLGERDWVVRSSNGELAIFEALRLDNVTSETIDTHVRKLVSSYDTDGKRAAFLIVYYQGNDFQAFWPRYLKHARSIKPVDDATFSAEQNLFSDEDYRNIGGQKFQYRIRGVDFYLYHLVLDLSE